jgi:diketogulonate reductase-like aldo/keto reductase
MELLTICKIKPIINQIETHPYLNQQSLVDICQKNDIAVIASSPLCRGSSCVKENTNILED